MLCYRYLSRKYGLLALQTGKFKLSRITETNDLFDCAGIYSGYFTDTAFQERIYRYLPAEGKRKYHRVLDSGNQDYIDFVTRGLTDDFRLEMNYESFHLRDPISRVIGLLCMSEARNEKDRQVVLDESLMWAHYAEKGKGIRIGLKVRDPDQKFVVRVKYEDYVPASDLHGYPAQWGRGEHERVQREFAEKRVMTKSRAWSYENEVRLVKRLSDPRVEEHNGLYFVSMNPERVQSVDFGPQCFKSDYAFLKYAKALRAKGYSTTQFRLARMDPTTYGYKYVTEEYVRRSALCAKCFHIRNATMSGIGPFFRWWGKDYVYPAGASSTRTFEDVLGDMLEEDFECWYDGFRDMTRRNATPFARLRMMGIVDHLHLSREDRFLLESEIFPLH